MRVVGGLQVEGAQEEPRSFHEQAYPARNYTSQRKHLSQKWLEPKFLVRFEGMLRGGRHRRRQRRHNRARVRHTCVERQAKAAAAAAAKLLAETGPLR